VGRSSCTVGLEVNRPGIVSRFVIYKVPGILSRFLFQIHSSFVLHPVILDPLFCTRFQLRSLDSVSRARSSTRALNGLSV
jgi:hypothetical protein